MEELRKHLSSHLTPESGLVGLILSDREGVPLLRSTRAECPETVTRPAFLAAFAGSSQEVGGKLGLGRNTSLVAVYGQYQVIHHQHQQVILTMVASSEANTGQTLVLLCSITYTFVYFAGYLLNMSESLQPFMTDISSAISE